jgi:hypothetical protein
MTPPAVAPYTTTSDGEDWPRAGAASLATGQPSQSTRQTADHLCAIGSPYWKLV